MSYLLTQLFNNLLLNKFDSTCSPGRHTYAGVPFIWLRKMAAAMWLLCG